MDDVRRSQCKSFRTGNIVRQIGSRCAFELSGKHDDFIEASGSFYYHGLTLIPAWISNHIYDKIWLKLLIHSQTSTVTVEVWEWISDFIPHFTVVDMRLFIHAGASTHWGRVTHICVGKLTIKGSDNGLSPERRQAIIWTNTGILLIGPLGTTFKHFHWRELLRIVDV